MAMGHVDQNALLHAVKDGKPTDVKLDLSSKPQFLRSLCASEGSATADPAGSDERTAEGIRR